MNKKLRQGLRTWIEIDRKAIAHNYRVFRSLISESTKLMAVVKSNAYGHGLIGFSKEAEKLGADFLGVDSITEARALRREGIKIPILVLGYTMPELIAEAAELDVSLTVSTFEGLNAVLKSKSSNRVKIHIKVDSGMHRQGFLFSDSGSLVSRLKSAKKEKILVEGVFTHFAAAKNPAFRKDTDSQISDFKKWIELFQKNDIKPIVHASATSGTMIFPEAHFDMVRIGIGLYGLWPEKEVKEFLKDRIILKPVLVWKSIVTELKSLEKGSRIGYGLTETFMENKKVAIVPVGYWHGYPRVLSSIGRIVVKGKECKVLGIVSMDMISIDVSKASGVKVGDEVVVIGAETNLSNSMEGITNVSGLWWYETVTRLNPLIRRFYV